MRKFFQSHIWKSALLLTILLATTHALSAQALITADRGTEITPFAQYTLVDPDWGQTNNFGYVVGIDYTRFIRNPFVQPSLEFRYTRANGKTVNERSYAGGFKFQTIAIHGIRPYLTMLVGHGNIDMNYFNNGYQSDNSFIYAIGGGAEFNVTPCWKVRLDVSSQAWNLEPNNLNPLTVGVGVAYSLPSSHNRRVQ